MAPDNDDFKYDGRDAIALPSGTNGNGVGEHCAFARLAGKERDIRDCLEYPRATHGHLAGAIRSARQRERILGTVLMERRQEEDERGEVEAAEKRTGTWKKGRVSRRPRERRAKRRHRRKVPAVGKLANERGARGESRARERIAEEERERSTMEAGRRITITGARREGGGRGGGARSDRDEGLTGAIRKGGGKSGVAFCGKFLGDARHTARAGCTPLQTHFSRTRPVASRNPPHARAPCHPCHATSPCRVAESHRAAPQHRERTTK